MFYCYQTYFSGQHTWVWGWDYNSPCTHQSRQVRSMEHKVRRSTEHNNNMVILLHYIRCKCTWLYIYDMLQVLFNMHLVFVQSCACDSCVCAVWWECSGDGSCRGCPVHHGGRGTAAECDCGWRAPDAGGKEVDGRTPPVRGGHQVWEPACHLCTVSHIEQCMSSCSMWVTI